MTDDELKVLNAMRTFPHGSRISRQDVLIEARLPLDRLNKALDGLDKSGHVWLLGGDKVRLSSDGTTFDT